MTLKQRLDDLIDKIAEKLNWLLLQKEDVNNKKGYLNSDNANYYPNIPAVNAGIAQAIIDANIYTDEQIDIILLALDNKVDKIPGKGLSTNDFTDVLKQKLEDLEGTKYRGAYTSLNALKQAYPEGENETWHQGDSGFYADVGVEGSDDVRYVWDPNDFVWVQSSLAGLTPEQVKQLYLQNSDTNNFSDFWQEKLHGIEDGAQVNVQSDWNQTNSNNDSYIKNKPTKLSQFQNDPNFVSQQWVEDQEYLQTHQSLEGYALLSDIKNGKLTLTATGSLSGGTKEFTANQDGSVTFTIDLNTVTKNKIDDAFEGRIVSMDVVYGLLILTTQDNTDIKLDLDLIKEYMDIPTKVSELENDEKFIKGKGVKQITVGADEPQNPDDGDLWVVKKSTGYEEFSYAVRSSKVVGSNTNIPTILRLSHLSNEFWDMVQSDGGDIRIYDSDNNQLAREIVWIDKTSKQGEVWFKANLTDQNDSVFKIRVDGLSSDYADNHAYGKHAVWSNGYLEAFHLHNDKSSTSDNEITRRSEAVFNSVGVGTYGSSIEIVNDALQNRLGGFDTGIQSNVKSVQMLLTPKENGNYMFNLYNRTESQIEVRWDGNGGSNTIIRGGQIILTDGLPYNYQNNVERDWYIELPNALDIQTYVLRTNSDNWSKDGRVEEVRISSVARSTDWLKTEANMRDEDFAASTYLGGDSAIAKPLIKVWDEALQEWIVIGEEDEDYPDYAQQLEDGLNF